MRNGHKGRMACGILELMLGVGLILYICLADRQRIGLAAVAAVVVTAGLGTFRLSDKFCQMRAKQ